MTVAPREISSPLLTYEAYLAEGEVFQRYYILDGVRIFMPDPTRRHQRILGNVYRHFHDFEVRSGRGQAIMAPQDVLITRTPLRTRQPDVLFISHEQLGKCKGDSDPEPLLAAPELVVEILSPSETRRARLDKIQDYCKVGVRECWVVSPDRETVEVMRLATQSAETVATYGQSETIHSVLYPDLAVPVVQVFAV
ncbi:MAG TPA: Uma2 family endonuclease [Armatimonadota bacterium]|nr:Uma2 family endonuclease [Armatimonadota bacterium]